MIASTEEREQRKVIKQLNGEREAKAREAAKAMGAARDTHEELKVKELVILDLSKKHSETAIRLREFSKLYDVVKSDRNKYVNQIQASAQALAEMKEKLKILQNEVEILTLTLTLTLTPTPTFPLTLTRVALTLTLTLTLALALTRTPTLTPTPTLTLNLTPTPTPALTLTRGTTLSLRGAGFFRSETILLRFSHAAGAQRLVRGSYVELAVPGQESPESISP